VRISVRFSVGLFGSATVILQVLVNWGRKTKEFVMDVKHEIVMFGVAFLPAAVQRDLIKA
jgi:hypothetical protein